MIISRARFRSFTLLETIITIVIMSILIWVIFQVYVMVGRIAVFVQGQKWIHDEMIYVIQTMQNLVDSQSTVLWWFDSLTDELKNWFDERLVLSDDTFTYIFTKVCTTTWFIEECVLQLEKDDDDVFTTNEIIPMTDPDALYLNNFYIRKLPYLAAGWWWSAEENYERAMHEWFWLFMDVESPRYDPEKWWFSPNQQYQIFFNVRKY